MKLSYNWLKTYIDPGMSPSQLGEFLTGIGLETGGIEQVESIKGGLEGMVIGRVVTCEPHPGSDHLSKTTVDIGSGKLLNIVCGAPNVAAGQKVVVATEGAKIYNGNDSFSIKRAKIRGELSEGMICSEKETGLGSDQEGIMVLPGHAPVGQKASDYYQIEADWVLEIDITPNRIDSASHLGVARDLAAALKSQENRSFVKPSVDDFKVGNQKMPISVEVLNPEACPRYSGVSLTGVEVKESPVWLKNRLKSLGLVPINNVVDVTNFVLFETGQPLHAFDADKIRGGKVVVKTLPADTKFITLDSAERTLSGSDLMICDTEGGMCLAGVFGGVDSGVKSTTRNVFLESACFDPVYIRKTSRRHGLNTDASFRFERGTDINGTLYALKRAAMLIMEVAGGIVPSEIQDVYPHPVPGYPVEVSWFNIKRLIGKELGQDTIKSILSAIEIDIVQETPNGLSLMVPAYRVDVRRECDVIEEILRFYGYNKVEIPVRVNASLNYARQPDPEKVRNIISEQLVSLGFDEIWSNSLTKSSYYDDMQEFKPSGLVKILNPLSIDLNCMRQTLLYGGLECITHNVNRKNSDLRLFEFGNCYTYRGTQLKENPVDNYGEEEHLALFLTGNLETSNWTNTAKPVSFHLLKSYVENIIRRLGFIPEKLKVTESESELFSAGLKYEIGRNKIVELGIVASPWLKKADVETPVFYADFDWNQVMLEIRRNNIKFSELPKYPEVKRDLALVLDKETGFDALRNVAFKTERHLLQSVNLFDIYEGKGIPEGKKSYAVSFILRDPLRTLNDRVIEKTMEKLLASFEKELGARLR